MTMKRIALAALMTCFLMLSSLGIAYAESTSASWNVTFNSDKQMVSDYDQEKVNDAINAMMPGDDLSLDIAIKNECANSTEWYMTSTVLKTLEDANEASGGAYTYSLDFTDEAGVTNTIYSSDTVGGESSRNDASKGLKEVSGATGSWLYVATLASGKGGTVQLNLSLDGMTQENNYMRQEGGLEINFAVEDSAEGSTVVTTQKENSTSDKGESSLLPKTGDLLTNTLLVVVCILLVSATVYSFTCDRKKALAMQGERLSRSRSNKGGVR